MNATTTEREKLRARLAELNDELESIDERRADIKGQIEKAQAETHITGTYADPDWLRRAKGALRHLEVERAEVCRDLGEGNRKLRRLNAALDRGLFYEATRFVVDDATWAQIVARQNELTASIEGN